MTSERQQIFFSIDPIVKVARRRELQCASHDVKYRNLVCENRIEFTLGTAEKGCCSLEAECLTVDKKIMVRIKSEESSRRKLLRLHGEGGWSNRGNRVFCTRRKKFPFPRRRKKRKLFHEFLLRTNMFDADVKNRASLPFFTGRILEDIYERSSKLDCVN